jgi:hypothetical protein
MFRNYQPGKAGYVVFIADYQPFQTQSGGPNFYEMDPNSVYDIDVSNNGGATPNLTFRFQFTNTDKNIALNVGGQTVPVAEVNVGPVGPSGSAGDTANLNVTETYTLTLLKNGGSPVAITNYDNGSATFTKPLDYVGMATFSNYANYANHFMYNIKIPGCAQPGRVFAGQRAEPCYVDLGETFDLLNYKHPIGEQYANSGQNDIAQYNITALAIEVPIACVLGASQDPVIGAWTTALSNETVNGTPTLVQKSRLGMPLVNEVVIGLKDKDTWNASAPKDDAQFLTYVTNPTFPAIVQAVFGADGIKAPTNFPRNDLVATFLTGIAGVNQPQNVVPSEMLRLNTSIAPTPQASQSRLGVLGGDNAGFPNGRRPGDDVVDLTVRVAMGRLCTLGLNGYCTASQAPSGGQDFVDGAALTANNYKNSFPFLNPPQADSSN